MDKPPRNMAKTHNPAPLDVWRERHPDPTLGQLIQRHAEVSSAVERSREAGRSVRYAWIVELGLDRFLSPTSMA